MARKIDKEDTAASERREQRETPADAREDAREGMPARFTRRAKGRASPAATRRARR